MKFDLFLNEIFNFKKIYEIHCKIFQSNFKSTNFLNEMSPLHIAVLNNFTEIVKILVNTPTVDTNQYTIL